MLEYSVHAFVSSWIHALMHSKLRQDASCIPAHDAETISYLQTTLTDLFPTKCPSCKHMKAAGYEEIRLHWLSAAEQYDDGLSHSMTYAKHMENGRAVHHSIACQNAALKATSLILRTAGAVCRCSDDGSP